MTKGKIVLAAGGTGGHLFPAEALGAELQLRGYEVHLLTDGRAQRFVRFFDADHVHVIHSATIKGKNPIAIIKTLWQLLKGVRQSRKLLRNLKPVLVGGFGGYPTLPPLYAATSIGLPTFIHEQNAVMGRANRFLAGKVTAIAGGFLSAEGEFASKIIVTGNPVRPAVIDAAQLPYKVAQTGEPFNLLVFGGSQGASFFSEILPQALKLIDETKRKSIFVTQQARQQDIDSVKQAYSDLGIKAEVASFFDNMAERIASAQFIIARSGASTVAEIAAIGRPALLVPYPYALDHDQAENAASLATSGGVKVLAQKNIDADVMAEIITGALDDPKLMATMAAGARQAGRLQATQSLADMAEGLIAKKSLDEIKKTEATQIRLEILENQTTKNGENA
ncbi:undecaprenyldiphospho-muramoylpentapeptide beta-N-acetylglucosaminyltransferase [Bartonella sp. HY329]|uniref:undecaprenyldiphospho-muramoylpentapeptide beta-N-acetylglucosaminyltransferase n=1 Tax=unclassified Bartonella TaxID=2645622 RepID=UPI0021CA32B4|nr:MULTISPECIES: undecaprenyldiphospho-muramoylpentapeptide beta-N-acetylglucosaminyltransferase [unclassified Bartonella]UXM95882.1 undecaprenyldiphospho-muramoylpentapeptide beta-N-acetylglucosaminyltransferase [Bartonella sp. HY329]UXN10207.1 undecaprenyldiphospho-muramoylpentapeptide beta-N-acetylglucosaminyltransferase [Bartonella sp. HY328]